MKVTEALVVEHTVFSKVFDEIDRALLGLNTLEEARLLGTLVTGLLQNHGATEENLFFLTMNNGPAGKDQLYEFQHEHQEIDARLKQAQAASNLDQARQFLIMALRATREHFRHEERVAFPLIERTLHHSALRELGSPWMQDDSSSRAGTDYPPPVPSLL